MIASSSSEAFIVLNYLSAAITVLKRILTKGKKLKGLIPGNGNCTSDPLPKSQIGKYTLIYLREQNCLHLLHHILMNLTICFV